MTDTTMPDKTMKDPAPQDLDQVLTPEWLTAALSQQFPGTRVTSVTPGPVISRVSTNARFTIDGEIPQGLGRDLCIKGYFNEIGKPFGFLGGIEGTFYRDLAASTGIRTLRAVYADVDPVTHHGVVITEDVIPQGAVFLDALSDYSTQLLADSLAELAKLHSSTWQRQDLLGARWLDSRAGAYTLTRGIPEITANFTSSVGSGVPEEIRDPQRVYDGFKTLIERYGDDPQWCVVHGDAHVGNMYLDGDGQPSFLDWQLIMRGPWYFDVGYHLASAIPVDQRRAHEDELIRHYLDRLSAGGVALDRDEAAAKVRLGMLYGFYLWAITYKVDPAITTELNTRLGTAVADHDVLTEVLG